MEKIDLSGERINNILKELLPKGRLSKFERNFVAYKLSDELKGKSHLEEVLK